MSDATIDSLRIEIDANASKAASGLDSLISKLGQLNSAASPSTTSNLKNLSTTLADFKKNSVSKATGTNLQTLVNAANGLSGSSVANLGSLTGNLKDLSTVKISKTIGTNLGRITTAASGVSNSSGVGNLASALKSGSSAMGGMKAQSDSLYTSLNQLARVIRTVTVVAGAITAIGSAIGSALNASNTYIEDMNLANTVLGEYADSAHELAESYQEIFGIDSGAFLRNMGTFDSMAQGMGVASDNAVLMSKNLAQLGYDLASYYNISNDAAMEKLRSGLAGEIEPLRALGFDLTSARLQQEAYNLGLNETVSNMTQAEKAMLRYQAIMNQVAWSHGDLAKTIQSPSNMLRVFQQNVTIAARSIGNAFLPMLQAILPVGIAVAKVLATVGNMIADLTGGTQIANTEFGSGGLDGVSTAADDASDALDNAADAADGTGGAADDAAGKVKELKRQLMGFDEINKFSTQSTGSGSGGNGGSGGGGGGNGAGDSGSGGISLDNYDWIGEGLGDDLYNELMKMVARLQKALKPLAEAISVTFAAIKNQFRDLDMVGAVENAIAGVVNLISNAARNIIEILAPLAVAFNFPETIALGFDLAAQACITLSSAINGVGSMVKGFTDTALIPLVSWIGDKVRGAIKVCIEVLASWGQWFRDNTPNLNELGQAAGVSAGLILKLATAVADVAFAAAADAFKLLNTILQNLMTILVNSAAARTAATLLGAALTTWAIGKGLGTALTGIGTAFQTMAGIIEARSLTSKSSVAGLADVFTGGLKSGLDNAKAGASLLGEQLGILTGKSEANSGVVTTLKDKYAVLSSTVKEGVYNSLGMYADAAQEAANRSDIASKATQQLQEKHSKLESALVDAASKEKYEKETLDGMKQMLETSGTSTDFLATKQQAMKVKVASANTEIAAAKLKLNEAKVATQTYAASNEATVSGLIGMKTAEMAASSQIVVSTAKKALATAGTTAYTVAQTALNVAMNAIPGMIVITALNGILTLLQPITDGLFNMAKGFLCLDDATGDVTDTTEEANEVLSEEQQQINSNLESIEEYEKSHNNLADALAASRMSEEEFATYLQQTGQSLEDVTQKADDYVDTMVNGMDKISTEGQISADEMLGNLQSNYETMQTWSANLTTLMEKTGLDSSNALIKELSEGGPTKYAAALQEIVNGGDEKIAEFKAQAQQYGDAWSDQLTSAIDSSSGEYFTSGSEAVGQVNDGASAAGDEVVSTASSIDEQTVSQFGSHYNEALDAGRNLSGGFGDGVAASDMVALAVSKAKDVCSQTVQAFNGGDGYSQTLAAGRNMTGGYGDGIAQAMSGAVSKAKNVMTQVVQALNGGTGYNNAMNAGKQVGTGYVNGIKNVQSQAVSAAKNIMNNVVTALKSNVSGATSSGRSMLNGYVSGINAVSNSASSAARNISNNVSNALKSGASTASSSGRTIGQNFVNGINNSSSSARTAGSTLARNATDGLGGRSGSANIAGKNLAIGFSNGISAYNNSVYWKGYSLAGSAISGIKARARIGSPSKVTHQFGIWLDEGLANGMGDGVKTVVNAAQNMTQKALDVTATAGEIGATVGAAFGSGIADGIDAKQVAQVLAYANESTAAANAVNWSAGSGYPAAHANTGAVVDDNTVAAALTGAVVDGLMSVQLATSNDKSGSTGSTEIVLKVDSQTLARAVLKGNESLARRGVLSFT